MEGKTLLASGSPITQRIDAVKALLAWKKVSCDPLPQEVSLDSGRLVLVLSKKKDCYYVTTVHACSCLRRHIILGRDASIAANTSRSRSQKRISEHRCLGGLVEHTVQ
jgi:hypothetical protein